MKTERTLRIFSRFVVFTLIMVSTSFLWINSVFADYVLPYPSFMPGNKVYRISRIADSMKQYWYVGNIAQIKYHLALSDKYLVEAKTLFEYKQYLLAMDALSRSNIQFSLLPDHIVAAKKEGKDISAFESMVKSAAVKHTEVLRELIGKIPHDFTWTPEKSESVDLDIQQKLEQSIQIRHPFTVSD